jgi:isohexenylglutaconyl-CoA hydratase
VRKNMSPQYETVQLERERDWLTVWLNRPESRNALSSQMLAELLELLGSIAGDRSIRGVTLRGRGGVFCAGGDLKGFKSSFQSGAARLQEIASSNRKGGELYDRINSLPQVVVALVEGAAMAGGLGMVCCADVVIVCADAKFALTETSLGIPPAQIAPFVAERLGLRTARRLMLTAARFRGDEALSLGLADFVVSDASALFEAEARIRKQVRGCAPGANAVTKDILLASRHLDREAMLDYAAAGFAKCMLSDEGREGIAAFVEKRKPSWALATDEPAS